jgi:hypothetical protein
MTVGELKEILEDYDDSTPVIVDLNDEQWLEIEATGEMYSTNGTTLKLICSD